MTTPAIIPVFDPQGTLRDVPQDQLQAAVKAGGTPSVRFKAPDGAIRFVPASRTQDAVKAGGTLLPIEQQDVQHPGFWSTLGNDLKGMASSAYHGIVDYDPLTDPKLPDSQKNAIVTAQQNAAAAQNQARTQAHGRAYSLGATAAEMAGSNVSGMEQSAAQGDVGGVLGHAAAAPAVLAAGTAASELPLGRIAKATGAGAWGGAKAFPGARTVRGVVRGAAKSWQASAPDIEIPSSKVSSTPPEASAKVSVERLQSDIQSLGYSKADALARAKAGVAKYPNDLSAATTEAMRTSGEQQTVAPPTPPPSKPVQVAQVRAAQTGAPIQQSQGPTPAVQNPSTIAPRMQQIAQQPGTGVTAPEYYGRDLRIAGQPVPADANLAPALQKSLPSQARLEGKVMQAIREQGKGLSIGKETLMDSPKLRGEDPTLVEKAVVNLAKQGKIWHEQTGGGAHEASYTVALKAKK